MHGKSLFTVALLCFAVSVINCGDVFASEPEHDGHAEAVEHSEEGGFAAWELVKPLGIATLGLLLLTGILGLTMWFFPKTRVKILMVHRIAGIFAVIGGLSHATLIFMLH